MTPLGCANVDDAAAAAAAPLVLKVSAAASVVGQALEDLLQHVRQYTARGEPIGRYDQATDTIMTVTESIFSSMGDAGESREDVLMDANWEAEWFVYCWKKSKKKNKKKLLSVYLYRYRVQIN